jgi:acid phosphatase type 7
MMHRERGYAVTSSRRQTRVTSTRCTSHRSSENHRVSKSKLLRLFALAIAVLAAGVTVAVAADTAAPALADARGVTIAVTGDVFTPDAKVVSDAILAHPEVSAVLLAGDTDNDNPTPLESFQKLYKGTYDRFLDKIYPCPGNHDEHSKPPFSAYCTFWGKVAHAPEMYYSFDLGGWHMLSLDSVTFAKGGEKATTQLTWLKSDLAANASKPMFVYWHYPLFSRAKHLGMPKMKPFWDTLYAHGPAIVINGHNHVYERFAPLDPDGKEVAETKGIQEFVVCPGGAKPIEKETPNAPGPASVKFHGNAQHVGYFTLYADGGYRYTIDTVAHSGATTVVDTGCGNLISGPAPKSMP